MAILEKTRDEIKDEYKWDLNVLYENDNAWQEEFKEVNKTLKEIEKYKDNITSSSKILLEATEVYFNTLRKLEKLFMYAHLNYDSCTENAKFETNLRKIEKI